MNLAPGALIDAMAFRTPFGCFNHWLSVTGRRVLCIIDYRFICESEYMKFFEDSFSQLLQNQECKSVQCSDKEEL